MNFIADLIGFIRKPDDSQFSLSTKEKWKFFGVLLLVEIGITFLIVFPIIFLVDYITPLRSGHFFEDYTLLKSLILLVFLIPLIEEFIFRTILRYSGLVEAVVSRSFWDKVFPYLVYSLATLFGLVHISNYENTDTLFFLLAPLLILSQLTGGFIMSYIRVRLNFWWGFLYHASWNFLFVIALPLTENLFTKPYIDNTQEYSLQVSEEYFFKSNTPKYITMERSNGILKKLDTEQYVLQQILDTLYGKNQYYTDSEYLKINFNSEKGISEERFLDLIKDEYDIISEKTLKKLK